MTTPSKLSWADIEEDDYVESRADDEESNDDAAVAATPIKNNQPRRPKADSRGPRKTPAEVSNRQYPIRFHPYPSTMSRVLYDIHGNPLLDDEGNHLHVWNPTLKTYLSSKRIRFRSHSQRKPFSWFTTNEAQAREFSEALKTGKSPTWDAYHVYIYEPDTPLPWGN